jgi:hypothetical protein
MLLDYPDASQPVCLVFVLRVDRGFPAKCIVMCSQMSLLYVDFNPPTIIIRGFTIHDYP